MVTPGGADRPPIAASLGVADVFASPMSADAKADMVSIVLFVVSDSLRRANRRRAAGCVGPIARARLPCASNHESYPSGYSHRESRTADSPPRTLSKNASRNASDARDAGARERESMTYEADSASDSDEEKCDARARRAETEIEREVEAELGADGAYDASSWEGFWRRATATNEVKMRRAGLDPRAEETKERFGRHGQRLKLGKPVDGETVYCFGCEKECDETYECAQCLEIYRARAKKVAFDAWERAFFCSGDCYLKHWDEHKTRHGPSTAGPTKLDGTVHEFEAPKGHGALWHAADLRRVEFEECVPIL